MYGSTYWTNPDLPCGYQFFGYAILIFMPTCTATARSVTDSEIHIKDARLASLEYVARADDDDGGQNSNGDMTSESFNTFWALDGPVSAACHSSAQTAAYTREQTRYSKGRDASKNAAAAHVAGSVAGNGAGRVVSYTSGLRGVALRSSDVQSDAQSQVYSRLTPSQQQPVHIPMSNVLQILARPKQTAVTPHKGEGMGGGQVTPGSSSEVDSDCSSSAVSQQRAVGVAPGLMAHPLNLLLTKTSSSLLEEETTWVQGEGAKSGMGRLEDSCNVTHHMEMPRAEAVGAGKSILSQAMCDVNRSSKSIKKLGRDTI